MQTTEEEPSRKGLGVETDDFGEAGLRRQVGEENKIPRKARDTGKLLFRRNTNMVEEEIRREREVDSQHI